MNGRRWMCAAALAAAAALGSPARAADKMTELERKLDALSQEVERLKLGSAAAEPTTEEAAKGQAPAATKVYRAAPQRVSIGGYGEFVVQDFAKRRQNADPANKRDEADAVRAVLYAGYKYNDWILFNSELEFEHGSTGKARGEVSIEQAYLDFKLRDWMGIRAGLMIVPMGFLNEVHEPTTYHGARRPSVETNILPSTWRENGAGLFGQAGPVSWRSYVVSGLQAVTNTNVTGFRGSDGVRNGRSSGAKSFAEDTAWVSRVDASPVEGGSVGGSVYVGEADQGLAVHAVPVTLWEGHASAEYRGFEARALYAEGYIGNADTVNTLNAITNASGNSAPRKIFGGYAELAFDVLSLRPVGRHYLAPFFRYERYDTQADTPEAMAKDPANSRVEYTLGLTYRPIPQVAVKADHQWMRNQARTGVNQWNLGLGYIF